MTEQAPEMPLVAHLVELRTRLVRVLAVLVVGFFALVYFRNDLYAAVSLPLRELLPAGSTMIATDVTAPFMAPFKLTFFVALFAAVPYILHQIWGFISPALYRHEKRVAVPLLVSSVLLFYAGVAFAYFITLPAILGFFTKVGPTGVAMMTDINLYLDFVLKLFLVFGFTFEIPVAVFLVISTGIVSSDTLIDKRRYVIVFCFFIAMFLTPPDALSMAMLAVPMWLLFEAGLFFGRLMEKRKAAELEG
ncbi:MAG TPA: twin-arginine translocase subunit TatC [Moraxellaceae bacterium]|nr:twin-arginine translocase subunit TatC [Moraxellaceae bacterium]